MQRIHRLAAVAAVLTVPWYVVTGQPEWAVAMVVFCGLEVWNGR